MKKIITILSLTILIACSKSKDNKVADCDAKMTEQFKDKVNCNPGMQTSLFKGVYKGQDIYYLAVVCASCDTTPPMEGYRCDGTKISIEDFSNSVKNSKIIDGCRNS